MKKLLFFIGLTSSIITLLVFVSGRTSIPQFIDTILKMTDSSTSLEKLYNNKHNDFYDFATSESECVFPDVPSISAPRWVCDNSFDDVEFTAVGMALIDNNKDKEKATQKAYISALNQIVSSNQVYVKSMMKSFDNGIIESESEQTSYAKIGSNVTIKGISKSRGKYLGDDNDNDVYSFRLLTQVELTQKGCYYKYTSYGYLTDKTEEINNNSVNIDCGFNELVKALEKEGVEVLGAILSPRNMFYVGLGVSQEGLNNIVHILKKT